METRISKVGLWSKVYRLILLTFKFNQIALQVSLHVGDITKLELDCITNAANKELHGGTGVDGAIHSQAGPLLLEENLKIVKMHGHLKVGQAVISGGYRLPAKYIVAAVGPKLKENSTATEKQKKELSLAYTNSLYKMRDNNLRSIAFPSISTGAYHFAKDKACRIAVGAITNFLKKHEEVQGVPKKM